MSLLDNRICRQFEVESKGDYENRLAIVGKMRYTLEQISAGSVPNDACTKDDILKLADSLCKKQRASQGDFVSGSWAVAEPFNDLPPDEFLDLAIFPTVLGLSLLSRMVHKEWIELDEEVYETIKTAFGFICQFPFGGEGLDRIYQQNELLLLLGLGRVPDLLLTNPDLSPDFLGLLKDLKVQIQSKINNNEYIGKFGEDYTQGYQLALVALKNI